MIGNNILKGSGLKKLQTLMAGAVTHLNQNLHMQRGLRAITN